MRDLNFFSSYNEDKKSKKGFEMYFYGAIGALIAIILITVLVDVVRIFMLNSEIDKYNQKLNEPEFAQQLNEALQINDKIAILGKYDDAISDVVGNVEKSDIVTDDLLNDISGTIPKELSFKTFDINGYDLTITGTTHTRTSVAEFAHNLAQLPKVKKVHVNSITKGTEVGNDFSYEITCVLKEVE